MEELYSKILKDIEMTGFVTELRLASKMLERGWKVYQSETYLDKDFNISREIDIHAYIFRRDSMLNVTVRLDLIIEVKKDSKRPWIIFTTPKSEFFDGANGYSALLKNGENYYSEGKIIFGIKDFAKNFHKNKNPNIGRAFHEAFKNPSENSKIYESLISCCKAAVFMSESSFEKVDKSKPFDKNGMSFFNLFLPVVVLEGNLFETSLKDSGEIKLEEKDWLPIKLNYSSKKYADEDFGSSSYYPDIAKFDKIDSYLELIEKWFDEISPQLISAVKKHREQD